jgi:hypothetical protein
MTAITRIKEAQQKHYLHLPKKKAHTLDIVKRQFIMIHDERFSLCFIIMQLSTPSLQPAALGICSQLTHLPLANFCTHSLAVLLYASLFDVYRCPASGFSGDEGFGSVSMEAMESSTLEMVSAGLHWSLNMSMHMLPSDAMFGWKIFVAKLIFGALKG